MKTPQLTLASLLICLISFINTAQAQSKPSWARDYRGDLSFELNQDSRLNQLQVEARNSARQRQVAQRRADQKRSEVQRIQKQINQVQQQINQLNQSIAQNVTQKNQLKKQIQQLQKRQQNQGRRLELARSARANVQTEVESLKKREQNQKQRLKTIQQKCRDNPTQECRRQVQEMDKTLKKTQSTLKEKQKLFQQAQKQIQQLQKVVQNLKESIQKNTKKIQSLEQQNQGDSQQLAAKKRQKNQLTPRLNSTKNELRPLAQREQRAQERAREFQNRFQAYRSDLIQAVLRANDRGFREGQNAGAYDGEELARERGENYGRQDGDRDGENDGVREGRRQAYRAGERQGRQEGAAQARDDGERDGLAQGTVQGHTDAAQREGEVAGERRAQASDAAEVGTQQGQKAGLTRAQKTGERVGSQEGEEKATREQESQELKQNTVQGAFAGAFSRDVPRFPAGYTGPRARPGRGHNSRDIVERAYRDGYHFGYRSELRLTYQERVRSIYQRAYDSSYDRAYRDFVSRPYDADFASGRDDGYDKAYDETYPQVREDFFASARAQASQNPDRQSSEFQRAYQQAENETYKRVYEQIRQQKFRVAEQKTFDENIKEQTNIFREKRYAEVNDLYQNHAVLKFSQASITDTGIKGVASQDGVYQPGESITYNIELVNYGQKAADSVKVVLNSGEEVTLPAIPGRSKTQVTGAAQSQVPADTNVNQSFSNALKTYFDLSADPRVQGRHYSDTANGQINSGAKFQKTVGYPLALSGLKANGPLVYREKTGLQVNLKNNSERTYRGDIKVELSADTQGQSVVQNFSSVQELKDSMQLSDAQVLISDEADIYTPLSFQVKVSKNGVPLGVGPHRFSSMAKMPYQEKGDKVILVNSEASSTDLLDIVNDFNGVQNISLLDTSLRGKNSEVLKKGLKNKTLLVLEKGAINPSTERMIARSQNISLLMVDDQDRGLKIVSGLQTFKQGLFVKLKITNLGSQNILFANPLQNKGVKQHTAVLQANLKNYSRFLNTAELLRTTAANYIGKVRSSISAHNFFSPSVHHAQLLDVMNIHIIKEVGTVTKAYLASGGGVFGSGRDKDIADLVKKDKGMFHNQLIRASNTNVNGSNIGLALAGLDSYRMAKTAFDANNQLSTTAVNNRLFGALFSRGAYHDYDDDMEDEIRDYSSNLWRQLSSTNASRFAPF